MKGLSLLVIAKAVGGELVCQGQYINREISGAVIDSRLVENDYLFFAVKGERCDGHDFINQVYEKGALCTIVEKKIDTDRPYIIVDSSLLALKKLAAYYRSILNIKIIGITGSVGKTSTKEFIASVLCTQYDVLKTEGNFNNEIGVPLTILKIRQNHEIAVIEMGISDFGEMTRLSEIAKPDVCVITNIGTCHLENLGDREGVLRAKTEMFGNASSNCSVVLNGDDDKLITITDVKGKQVHFFGHSEKFKCYCSNIENNGIDGTKCNIHLYSKEIKVEIPIPGEHMVGNAMAASLIGYLLNVTMENIKKGIESIQSVGGRVNIIRGKYTVIDDCYNANPVSMKASLDLLSTAKGRKIAVIGDMYELGLREKELHMEIGNYASNKSDYIFSTGSFSEVIKQGCDKSAISMENVNIFENIDDLIYNIKQFVTKGDTILVKASHSMHFEKIVKALQ